MAATHNNARLNAGYVPCCPHCRSIRISSYGSTMKCLSENCGRRFREPINKLTKIAKTKSGSGVIAPLTYRQQECRRLLKANAR